MLYIIGLGLEPNCKDLTIKGLEALKKSDIIYFEGYTANINYNFSYLKKMCGKDVVPLSREDVEVKNLPVEEAEKKVISFLVPGDPLFATTHKEVIVECVKRKIDWEVINAPSILTVCGKTGLSLYKFGRVVSVPFVDKAKGYLPTTPYLYLKKNFENDLHTLVLLDIGMSPNEAIEILISMERKANMEGEEKESFFKNKKLFVCSRMNHADESISYLKVEDLKNHEFGKGPHCLIFPANMEFHEEEFLKAVVNDKR